MREERLYPAVDELLSDWGYTAHIARRGQSAEFRPKLPHYRSRRWVVERTHSWFNRFRRLLNGGGTKFEPPFELEEL